MRPIIALFAIALFLQACSHSSCQGTGSIPPVFYGFDSAALERVVIKKYKAGSNFTDFTDSAIYEISKQATRPVLYDTAQKFITWPFRLFFYPGTDAIIEVTNAGRKYHLKDITGTHAKSKYSNGLISSSRSADVCYNVISSYTLDSMNIATGVAISYGANGSYAEVRIQR